MESPPATFEAHEWCTLANFFADEAEDPLATAYMGVTWTTFRDSRHAMSKQMMKIRPAGFDPTSEDSAQAHYN